MDLVTRFLAIKTHYDHRRALPRHLKYSRVPTLNEYNEYLALYRDKKIGGEGFHECLNFNIKEEDTKIYLPPGYIPDQKKCNDDYILFTFKTDNELPSHVIGVHGGVIITSREGVRRNVIQEFDDVEPLTYHAQSQSKLTALFSSPIEYDFRDGLYTPIYMSWGNGLRYLTAENAKNIIDEAYNRAIDLKPRNLTLRLSVERELQVLISIREKYFNEVKVNGGIGQNVKSGSGAPPDKETGYIGEKYVYEKEMEYVRNEGLDVSLVEWISQALPYSVFDIKTVRKINGEYKAHYLEVKSTRMHDYNNVYISSNQIEFFSDNPNDSTFVFVSLDCNRTVIKCEEYSLDVFNDKFNLKPIKYRVVEK